MLILVVKRALMSSGLFSALTFSDNNTVTGVLNLFAQFARFIIKSLLERLSPFVGLAKWFHGGLPQPVGK